VKFDTFTSHLFTQAELVLGASWARKDEGADMPPSADIDSGIQSNTQKAE